MLYYAICMYIYLQGYNKSGAFVATQGMLLVKLIKLIIFTWTGISLLRNNRQHLSYDVWMLRGKIIRTLACSVVYNSCAQ